MANANAEKRKRTNALSKFTRNINTFDSLLDDAAPPELMKPQWDVVKTCWQALEKAHDDYLEKAEDIDDDSAGGSAYIDAPGERHTTSLIRYSAYLKEQAKSEKLLVEREEGENRLVDEEM